MKLHKLTRGKQVKHKRTGTIAYYISRSLVNATRNAYQVGLMTETGVPFHIDSDTFAREYESVSK